MQTSRSNLYLGLLCIFFALAVLVFWIPVDVETGLVEKVRGRFKIGDSLAPTVAVGFIFIGGVLLVIFERRASDQPIIQSSQVKFIAMLMAILLVSVLIMRFAGPLTVAASNQLLSETHEYRLLRTSFPWKYVGFVLGGVIMIIGIMSLIEKRITLKAIITAVVAVLIIILVFDIPFDDLLIPPNGDV